MHRRHTQICGRGSIAMSTCSTHGDSTNCQITRASSPHPGLRPRTDCDVYVFDPCGTYTTQWYLYALWLLRTTLAFGWMSRAACSHVFYVTYIHAGGPNHKVVFIRLRAIAAITRCSVPSLRECSSRCHRVQLVSQLWGGLRRPLLIFCCGCWHCQGRLVPFVFGTSLVVTLTRRDCDHD